MRNLVIYYPTTDLLNDFRHLSAPSEDALNERYTAVERAKFILDDKYRLHPNNFVKHASTELK